MRFGVREICDVVFKARTEMKIGNAVFKKGQPVLYITTAKTSTLEGAASTVYAQGGKGNPRLIAWEGERTVTFTVEDALLSPVSFAMLTGAGLSNVGSATSKNRVKVHTTFDLPILDGGIVKIDKDTACDNHDIFIDEDVAPVFGTILDNAGDGVVFCQLASDGVLAGSPTPNNNVYIINDQQPLILKFNGASDYVGKTMRVDCYVEKTSGATEITIDAENFAGNYYVEASTLFREQHTAKDMPAEIVLPNVKIQSNFTFSMANTGDPSTFTFTMDAFPDYTKFDKQHKVFAAIQIIGDENIHPDTVSEEEDVKKELDPKIEEVVGGGDWIKTTTLTDGGRKLSTLGNNFSATMDGTDIDLFGNLNRIDNWKEYSSNPNDLTGYYYPVEIKGKDGVKFIRRIPSTGEDETLVFGQTSDPAGTLHVVFAVNPDSPTVLATLEDSDGKRTDYTFDFCKVVFK